MKIINDYKKAIHQSERKDSKNNCPIYRKKSRAGRPRLHPALLNLVTIILFFIPLVVWNKKSHYKFIWNICLGRHFLQASFKWTSEFYKTKNFEVKGEFKYCDRSSKEIIDLNESCPGRSQSKLKFNELASKLTDFVAVFNEEKNFGVLKRIANSSKKFVRSTLLHISKRKPSYLWSSIRM